MFPLLVAAALSQPPHQPVVVDFGKAGQVSVPRPGKMGDLEARDKTYLSPRGDAAAVQFCWDNPKDYFCEVKLVRPKQPVQALKDSVVTWPLFWTPDGQYIISAGNNTIRLWNLMGKLRTQTTTTANVGKGFHAGSARISRIWFEGRFLCVAASGHSGHNFTMTTRYALPTLKPLETVTSPTSEFAEAPCQPPHTES